VGDGHTKRDCGALDALGLAAFACITLTLVFVGPAWAAGPSVGMVSKVQNAASVVTDGNAVSARVGTVVHMQDSVQTGSDGRLEVTFRDGTKVTLGENANIVVDKYVFNPDQSVGEASLNVTEGAFRFVTGRMNEMRNKSIEVTTTAAQIGVRGTNFWGGRLQQYGVLLFVGEVGVTAQGKTVVLAPGQGTDIPPGGAPGDAKTWSAAKIAEALKTISFEPSGGGQPQQEQQQQQQQQPNTQQRGQLQQAPNQTYAVGTAIPVVIGAGVVLGVFIGETSGNDNKGGRGRASP
jgi:hypothetical protein